MPPIPRDRSLDSSLAFRREGYAFIANRCRRFQSDIFSTRLLGRRVFCIRGADAARMFYEPGRFTRSGALPKGVLHLLQDEGSVATLDGADHHRRKEMFLSIMASPRLHSIAELAAETLLQRARRWRPDAGVVLHEEFRWVLCKAVCRWSGLELSDDDLESLSRDLGAMIYYAGTLGPANWGARLLRRRTERLARKFVEDTRSGRIEPPPGSALNIIAFHEHTDGRRLPPNIAGIELINILRPTVAAARFMVFATLALHHHPEVREEIVRSEDALEAFVQEVRRYYPFFPIVAGIALEEFTWRDRNFKAGDRFVLDLYGTNHDPRLWEEAELFRPQRFLNWKGSAFDFIPQGGGDHHLNHRCAGEWLTIAVLESMLRTLAGDIRYTVPLQDLSFPLNRIPALPASGLVVTGVSA